MRFIQAATVCILMVSVCAMSGGCKDACDDLEDVCKHCNEENKEDCKSAYKACNIVKGPAGKDCCDSIVDSWEELCE